MALAHFGQFAHMVFERAQGFFGLALEADEREYGNGEAQFGGIEIGVVPLNNASFLETADAAQARRRRQADALRQLDVGDAPFILQLAQELPVDVVEVDHRPVRPAPFTPATPAENYAHVSEHGDEILLFSNAIVPLCNGAADALCSAEGLASEGVGPTILAGDRTRDGTSARAQPGALMHFDDRLATVLRLVATSPAMARIQYRQLIDLLGREVQSATSSARHHAAMARLDVLNTMIPAAERAAILREPSTHLGNADLVASLTLAEPEVASAAIAAADLRETAWLSLIPSLPVRARGILRHRGGYGAKVEALLDRLGIGDRALPPAAPDPARAARPELIVLEGGAAKPRRPVREEPSNAGIGSIVRRIEAFRKSQGSPQDGSESDTHDREPHTTRTRTAVLAFDFTTDTEGRVDWADGPLASGVIGGSLAELDEGPDDTVGSALRHHQPIRDVVVTLSGAPALAGSWRIDALPLFGGSRGAFQGYAGRLRRLAQAGAVAADSGFTQAGNMREILHELRTPANAIQVAAEIIQQQLYGPAPHEYRAMAAAIAGDTAQILAGFDELDRLVRLESGTLMLGAGECDLGPLVFETVSRLRAWTAPRGSGFSLPEQIPPMIVPLQREDAARLVWRLLAALAGVSAAGETIGLTFLNEAGKVLLDIDVPASLSQRLDEAADAGQPLELARSLSAGIFGIGFTLRLAAAEAAGAGGRILRQDGTFSLLLPGLTPAAATHTQT